MSSIYAFPIEENDTATQVTYYKEAFTKTECDLIIDSVKHKSANAGQIVTAPSKSKKETDIRNVHVKYVEYEDCAFLYDKLCQLVLDANETRYKADITGFMESMQLLHYGEDIGGGHYNWHTDNGTGLSTRKLTAIIQLSDPADYTGCELEITHVIDIPKTQGSVIIFPSYLPHRVTKLLSGNRNSLVVWVNGPPYR